MEYFSKSGTENGHDRGEKAKNHGTPPGGGSAPTPGKPARLGMWISKKKPAQAAAQRGTLHRNGKMAWYFVRINKKIE
ncbi:MAG: hypothetical protein IJ422_03570 [Oscillospiraceae bacterium]|nr:hypothetical protein [Oscillospiraceae bacterium]